MKYIVTDIVYDTDGEDIFDLDLPDGLSINVPNDITKEFEIIEYLSDKISYITGYCHLGFSYDKA